jgi:hypothetical protein
MDKRCIEVEELAATKVAIVTNCLRYLDYHIAASIALFFNFETKHLYNTAQTCYLLLQTKHCSSRHNAAHYNRNSDHIDSTTTYSCE